MVDGDALLVANPKLIDHVFGSRLSTRKVSH
jgi:hypothetical protein